MAQVLSLAGWWVIPWGVLALAPPAIALWMLAARIAPSTLPPLARHAILAGCGVGLVKVWITHGMPKLIGMAGNLTGLWPAT